MACACFQRGTWLREDVAPAYDEAKAHPERLLNAKGANRVLEAHLAKAVAKHNAR
jgi:hypothetical protein